jgi:hypothetical protein
MSEDFKLEDPIHAQIEKDALEERKKKEVLKKELVVRERRADNALEKIERGDKDSEIAKTTDYGALTETDILQKQKENTEYMLAARNKMSFINKEFVKAIPFFRKNLILVGGKTGEGKSTTVANIIREMVAVINPVTGKKRRILVLTNEEKSEDVYNRVTCLIKGWHYTNHDRFTDLQVETFNKYIAALSKDGMITVVDDSYHGANGTTTTLEGICQVFDNLIANKEYYDAVLIDYYQNIKESRQNPTLNEWEVQAALSRKLDQYKNIYPAPIVLLAQVTPPDEKRSVAFKYRIEGRKSILNVSTCAIEMIANREELCTEWLIHKSRFNEMVGESIITGYDKGRYVEHSEEFKAMVERLKASREQTDLNKAINPIQEIKEDG